MTSGDPARSIPRVFLSYSHDSDEHRDAVWHLAAELRQRAVDAWLDQYEEDDPPLSWPRWTNDQIRRARFVIAICSEIYCRRVEGYEDVARGHGATWEGAIITQELYERQTGDKVKFIPVVLNESDRQHIPWFLRATSHYLIGPGLPDALDALVRQIRGQRRRDIPDIRNQPDRIDEMHGDDCDETGAAASLVPVPRRAADAADRDEPAVVPLQTDDDWAAFGARYATSSTADHQWAHCLRVAREGGAVCAVVEPRYTDPDYRREFLTVYSQLFRSYPGVATRLHFFSAPPTAVLPELPAHDSYIGYVVMRPVEGARVGRTLLRPPPSLSGGVFTGVVQEVNIFGTMLRATGVPYVQTDPQFGSGSASAACWMCHFSAYLRGIAPRKTTIDFWPPDIGDSDVGGVLRASTGMRLDQLHARLRDAGMGVVAYDAGDLAEGRFPSHEPASASARLLDFVGRYVGSGFPLIAITGERVLVCCGVVPRDEETSGWVVHDSESGLYEVVDADVASGRTAGAWIHVVVPVPPRVWLSAEAAELRADLVLRLTPPGARASPIDPDDKNLRSVLWSRAGYQRSLQQRGLAKEAERVLRLAWLPEWFWAVEASARGTPDEVIAEVLFDAASTDQQPAAVAMLTPAELVLSEGGIASVRQVPPTTWRSGRPVRRL